MHIEHVEAVSMAHIERAHDALNAAFNAISVDRKPETLVVDIALARRYVGEARAQLSPSTGTEGPEEARAAARAVLPRIDHAVVLLDALATSRDPEHVAPLLDELGIAMDHVEAALAAVGWS